MNGDFLKFYNFLDKKTSNTKKGTVINYGIVSQNQEY